MNLGCLLGWSWSTSTSKVLRDISNIMELTTSTLNTIPDLSSDRWKTLTTNQSITTGTESLELSTDESRLGIAGTEESSVESQKDPRALGEDSSGEEEAAPEEDLQDSNESHGEIVVLLDELADGLREWGLRVGWLGGWGGAGWLGGGGWWCDRWENVLARVGCDVEDGVDAEWEHGQWVLWREEPDEGHG